MKLLTATTSALGAALLISSPAVAANETIDVVINPVELSTEAGVKRVLHRVRIASRYACPAPVYMPRSKVRECREEFAQDIITKLSQRLNDKRLLRLAIASGILGVEKDS